MESNSSRIFVALPCESRLEEYVPGPLKSLVDSNPGKKKWKMFGSSKARFLEALCGT